MAVGGCAKPPKVTKGRFNTSYTVTIQRGCTQVVVLTSGPARFIQKDYWMDHPMGQRPDTEAAVTTPAGKFIITDRNLGKPGVSINGTYYPDPIPCLGQTITIGPSGAITVKAAGPPPGAPVATSPPASNANPAPAPEANDEPDEKSDEP
jgi:hypothetical protein